MVIALADEVHATGRRGRGGASRAAARSSRAVARLQRVCQVTDGDAAAAAGAGRVPLPFPSAEVGAALDSLAYLIAGGARAPKLREASADALSAVDAVAYCAPQRAKVLAGHTELMRALAAALCAHGGGNLNFLHKAMCAALAIVHVLSLPSAASEVWRDSESGASLRALTVACAAACGAPGIFGDAPGATEFYEPPAFRHIALAVKACPETDRASLCASVAAQKGFVGALCACFARVAASVPDTPGAAARAPDPVGDNAGILLAVLCGGDSVELTVPGDDPGSIMFHSHFRPTPPTPADCLAIERMLAAAPALLERVVDVVAAGERWYDAVAAALGAGATSACLPLLRGFDSLRNLWTWSIIVLEAAAVPALSTATGRHLIIHRLVPALLALAEALQAVGCASPCFALPTVTCKGAVMQASSAVALVARVAHALDAAAPSLLDSAPHMLATLVRLSVLEPPLLAGDAQAPLEADVHALYPHHWNVRSKATYALAQVAVFGGAAPVAELLAASPELAAAAGAAAGFAQGECRALRDDVYGDFWATVAPERRMLAVILLACVAACAADGGAGDTAWLRRLAG